MKEANDSEKLPIRLLDVLGTISSSHKGNIIFTEGSSRGWDFHIISHTWSKGIRDLSEQIGKLIINNLHQFKMFDVAQLQTQISSASAGSSFSSSACMQENLAMADAYSYAFKEAADFSKVASYIELREFLQLLAGDGVSHVWFDALCIDQTNVEEKGREISNMGSYYHCSQGCYVLTHGVGEGYQLWGKETPRGAELPRWFSRVWTLQEFLLPRRLSFFVEALDPEILGFVKKLAKAKAKGGLCRCFCRLSPEEIDEPERSFCDSDPQATSSRDMYIELRGESLKSASDSDAEEKAESFSSEGLSKQSAKLLTNTWNPASNILSFTKPLPSKMQLLEQDKEQYSAHLQARDSLDPSLLTPRRDDIVADQLAAADRTGEVLVEDAWSATSTAVCTECQSAPMIREAKVYGASGVLATSTESSNRRRLVYLVDREAYLGVMQCDSQMTEPPPRGNTKGVQELRSLYARLLSRRPWRPYDVLVEVGVRNCSVEEDRVLGILGLLGKAGGESSQLRSGKTLRDQVRDLARVCSPDELIELCGMDVTPSSILGMSWAPSFHDPSCHDFWPIRQDTEDSGLSTEAYRESVSATGALKLRAKVVAAYVLPITALPVSLLDNLSVKYNDEYYPCSHFILIPPPRSPSAASLPGNLPHFLSRQSSTHVLSSADPALWADFSKYGFIPLYCETAFESADLSTPFINFTFHNSVSLYCTGSIHLPVSCTRSPCTSLAATVPASSSSSTPNLQLDPISRFDVSQLGFQMEMVLLAAGPGSLPGDRLELFMLCLKGAAATNDDDLQEQELHKIGMLSFEAHSPESYTAGNILNVKKLLFESANLRESSIGGFGADVSAHVFHVINSTGVALDKSKARKPRGSYFSVPVRYVGGRTSETAPTRRRFYHPELSPTAKFTGYWAHQQN